VASISLLQEPINSGTGDSTNLHRQARMLVKSLEQQAEAIGLRDPDIPAIARVVSDRVHSTCSAKRKLDQNDEAVAIVRRFVAFAEEIVAQFPDRADAYVVLSDANNQVAKNAWRGSDDPEAIRNVYKAFAAARHAAQLDPQSRAAQIRVAKLEDKVRDLQAESSKSADQ
jgi:hypothetical protein